MLGHRLVTQHLVPSSRVKGARQRIRLQTSRRFFFSVLDCAICSQAVPKQFPLQVEPQGSLTTSVPRIASCQLITLLLHNTLPIYLRCPRILLTNNCTHNKQPLICLYTVYHGLYTLSLTIYPVLCLSLRAPIHQTPYQNNQPTNGRLLTIRKIDHT
jgi:hypothetical protein